MKEEESDGNNFYTEDYKNLTKGIVELEGPSSTSSSVVIFNEKNFPVWVSKKGDVRIAAGKFEKVKSLKVNRTNFDCAS